MEQRCSAHHPHPDPLPQGEDSELLEYLARYISDESMDKMKVPLDTSGWERVYMEVGLGSSGVGGGGGLVGTSHPFSTPSSGRGGQEGAPSSPGRGMSESCNTGGCRAW